MKYFVVFMALTSLVLTSAIPESDARYESILNSLTELESDLLEQGYYVEPYSIMPFGNKHFFFKSDKNPNLSDTSFSRCSMSATFLLEDDVPMYMIMKFPNDLIWPGMYENSTFYLIKNHFTTTDKDGSLVIPEMVWKKIEPIRDSDFTTLEFDLVGEVSHVIVNMTSYPVNPNSELVHECPPLIPKMEFDYYDRVQPISTQRLISEMWGFPPDTFICENNLIGAIKATNDKAVCIKPESKIKLVERGWAKNFL